MALLHSELHSRLHCTGTHIMFERIDRVAKPRKDDELAFSQSDPLAVVESVGDPTDDLVYLSQNIVAILLSSEE